MSNTNEAVRFISLGELYDTLDEYPVDVIRSFLEALDFPYWHYVMNEYADMYFCLDNLENQG